MNPTIWLNRQPLPKLRTTLKHLNSWSNQDVVALANQMFGSTDLNNKQILELIKVLKFETTNKPPLEFYTDVPEGVGFEIKFKPNHLKLADTTYNYIQKGFVKTKFSTLQESLEFALAVIQDSKVPWEQALSDYMESRRVYTFKSSEPLRGYENKLKDIKSLTTPLPDNADDYKKYWGLQSGDKLEDDLGNTYVITQVRPTLDNPPTVVYEKLDL